MWGRTMIGYGSYDYVYESGHSGTAMRSGFSPRKAKLSLYGLPAYKAAPHLWDKLGKYTRGVACTCVNKPEDIVLDVLEELIQIGWNAENPLCGQ